MLWCLAKLSKVDPYSKRARFSNPTNGRTSKLGGGGGFIPGIIFNPSEKGLAYVRTDIGGAYRENADDSWTPLLDFVDDARWAKWDVDALAIDPVDPDRLYLATGISDSWTSVELPFKVRRNMSGRGMGEATSFTRQFDSKFKISQMEAATFLTRLIRSGGPATPRIFVGVANLGSTNIYVTEDAGETWNGIAGENSTFIPHKGVLSPAENSLYVSYFNNASPHDGTDGSVYKYNITSKVRTDITPVFGGDLYFGFGGLAVDYQHSVGSELRRYNSWKSYLQIGWMMEALTSDPFHSDHWLYGTGDGIEETAIQALLSPPLGSNLLSDMYDLEGFVNNSLTEPPAAAYSNPTWSGAVDLDYAGNQPSHKVRIGNDDSSSGKQVAASTDSGATWSQDYDAADGVNHGKVFSADAWSIPLGSPAKTDGYPALFAIASFDSQTVYFRSDDQGVNWVHINDASLGFGAYSANVISGDPSVYGRIYIGTNGRGIFYGDASGTTLSPTATAINASSSTAIANVCGECGGTGWTGPTVCASGSTCTYSNAWYSQCIPS
ncbi:hypothetical protein ACEPAH_1003 [Sanghuangporus vaninii]